MPIDLSEAARMATSLLLVAAVALPAGLVARVLRPEGEPLLPRWKPQPVPWHGFAVFGAFVVGMYLIPLTALTLLADSGFYQVTYGDEFPHHTKERDDLGKLKSESNRLAEEARRSGDGQELQEAGSVELLDQVRGMATAVFLTAAATGVEQERERVEEAVALHATLRMLWVSLFAFPLQLGALALTWAMLYARWRPNSSGSVAGKVGLAVIAWGVLTPVVLVLNMAVNAVSQQLDLQPDTHSLAKLGGRPPLDQVLLALEACVGAPLREEIIIRGVMLWWCVGRIQIPGAGVSAVTGARPWFVMIAATLFAATSMKWQPVVFAALLAAGLAVLWRCTHTGAQRARAVYATAAFFALMHPVWPNPLPLFVLGLGLGYLAVRTNGLLVPVLVHALFNAVSVAFVLRGPG